MSAYTCQALAQAERFQPFACSAQFKATVPSAVKLPYTGGLNGTITRKILIHFVNGVLILCACCTCISVLRGFPWRCRLQRLELSGE